MNKNYVVIKQLPDAGIGTLVHWDEGKNCYWYQKSVWVSPDRYNYLSSGSVRGNSEFFAPYEKDSQSYDSEPIKQESESHEEQRLKEKFDAERKRAIFWEDTAKKTDKDVREYREALKNAHAIIGRIVHYIEGRVESVNISKYFKEKEW